MMDNTAVTAETTVVITGSSRGIGFGLAEQFLLRGCRVMVNGSSAATTNAALERFRRYGDRVRGVAADVSSRNGLLLLHREALAHFGGVDIWINNAGISHETMKGLGTRCRNGGTGAALQYRWRSAGYHHSLS